MRSFSSTTYAKYLFYLAKILSCLDRSLLRILVIISYYLEKALDYNNLCVQCITYLVSALLFVPYLSVIIGSAYTVCVLCYYATLLPFFVLAVPLKHFVFGFNLYSFLLVSQGLASLYVCIFPHIKKCMPLSEKIQHGYILPRLLKSFEIEPKQIMSVVPLLVQKRKKCCEECLDTLIFCCLIFTAGALMSPIFLAGGIYF
jgi:hypothetical protein